MPKPSDADEVVLGAVVLGAIAVRARRVLQPYGDGESGWLFAKQGLEVHLA